MLGFRLTPLALTHLRTPLCPVVRVTDAAEEDGAAGESSAFLPAVGKKESIKADIIYMNASEDFCFTHGESFVCQMCGASLSAVLCSCTFTSQARMCSLSCFNRHAEHSEYRLPPCLRVGLLESEKLGNLPWELLCSQTVPLIGSLALLKREIAVSFYFPRSQCQVLKYTKPLGRGGPN